MSPASYQTAPPRVAVLCYSFWESGKRDSNPRPQPWQGCALPTELFPRMNYPNSHFRPEGNAQPFLVNSARRQFDTAHCRVAAPLRAPDAAANSHAMEARGIEPLTS